MHKGIGFLLEPEELFMDGGHAFREVHAVVLLRGDAHIGAVGEGAAFFLEDGFPVGDAAEAGDIPVDAVSEFFREPQRVFGSGEAFLQCGGLFRVPGLYGFFLAPPGSGEALFLLSLHGLYGLFQRFHRGGEVAGAEGGAVFLKKGGVFFRFAPVEPDDGSQIFNLPAGPFIEGAVYDGIVVPGVDEKHLVPEGFRLALVEEPQGAGEALRVEEVVSHTEKDVYMAGADELFPDILIGFLAVRRGGGHDEARPSGVVQIGVEVGDPQVIGIADFLFLFIDARQAEGQAARGGGGLRLHFVHVERGIGHDVVAAALEVMGVVIKGIGFVSGFDHAGEAVHGQIHQAELGVVFHLFLSVKGHGPVGGEAGGVHEIAGLYEHAAASAGRVQQNA